jgi:hypothetical protein
MVPRNGGSAAAGAMVSESAGICGLMYNDDILEALSRAIMLGSKGGADKEAVLPGLKKRLFDYDIYMVSFMSDADVAALCSDIKENGIDGIKPAEPRIKAKITAIRDNARTFGEIASKYNSVRAYIDGIASAEGKEGLIKSFGAAKSAYKLKSMTAASCKKFFENI